METTSYISDIISNKKESYIGHLTMKETPNPDEVSRDTKNSDFKQHKEEGAEFRAKESKEKNHKSDQVNVWNLYKEKSIRSNLWRFFVETFINEYKIVQIQKSLETGGESLITMELAVIWSKFIRTLILPAIGLLYWEERKTVSSLYKEGLDTSWIEED